MNSHSVVRSIQKYLVVSSLKTGEGGVIQERKRALAEVILSRIEVL
jgi:hypothetical protein